MYIENPKTKGSGIVTAIPQKGLCPNRCEDCFFQSGRSYLEPLKENLPNIPVRTEGRVVRVNDGNDSNVQRETVENVVRVNGWRDYFYNTAIPQRLEEFDAPVVLTVNPGKKTESGAYLLKDPPKNLMFVRFRTNTFNLRLADFVIKHYSAREVPIVLTFMAYFNMPVWFRADQPDYVFRKRTLNSYWAITTEAWEQVMKRYRLNCWVHSCGKIEGESGTTACRHCGNCLREYFATRERMRS